MLSVMLLAAVVAAMAFGVLAAYGICRVVFPLMGGRRRLPAGSPIVAAKEQLG